jgi:chromosome segregation ATPase
VRNLELALSLMEAATASRIEEVVSLTEKEITRIRTEKEAVETELSKARAQVALACETHTLATEVQELDTLYRNQVKKLEMKVQELNGAVTQLTDHMERARKREKSLELTLAQHLSTNNNNIPKTNDENTMSITEFASNEMKDSQDMLDVSSLLQQAHERCAHLESELQVARASMNDLILEIEAVCQEEAASRAQNERLLKQISDCQSTQRVALEENLKFQIQMDDMRTAQKEILSK